MYPDIPLPLLKTLAIRISDWIFDEAEISPTARTFIEGQCDYGVIATYFLEDLKCELSGQILYRAMKYRQSLKEQNNDGV